MPEVAAKQTASGPVDAPLVRAVLPTFSGQRAEDIILRAHMYDRDATLLTALGYLTGNAGFPKAPCLSYAWATSLAYLGDYEGMAVTALLALGDVSDFDNVVESKLALCATAEGNTLAGLLKDASIGDVAAICSKATKAGDKANAQTIQRQANEGTVRARQLARSAMTLMRELASRPATDQECRTLENIIPQFTPGILLLFAGTVDDGSLWKADIRATRLLDFIASQAKANKKSIALEILTETANNMVAFIAEKNAAGIRETLLAAHSGDVQAMRSMADIYSFGTHGAIRNERLMFAWMQHSALKGDSWSMLRLAGYHLERGEPAEAWAWADIAATRGDSPEAIRKSAEAMVELLEGRISAEVLQQGMLSGIAIMDAMIKRQEESTKGAP